VLLTPAYGDRPILSVEVRDQGPHPVMRQRRRLEALLRDLSAEDWHRPSRCAGWTVQDVITHLSSTNSFWAFSIGAGLAGEPTRFLATFDPVASPAQMVDKVRGTPVQQTLDEFVAGNDALAAVIDTLDEDGWATLAEAPPGHLPIQLVADHALWDSWVHERDVALPLDQRPVVEADEVRCCLRYGVGLGLAFALTNGATVTGAMAVDVDGPDDHVVVEVDDHHVRVHGGDAPEGAPQLRGGAVALVELLSIRDPGVAPPDGLRWLTDGLAEVFDQPSSH
jgi:uncharacterized protein (TIGR03083 family)